MCRRNSNLEDRSLVKETNGIKSAIKFRRWDKGSVKKSIVSAYFLDIRHSCPSATSRNHKLHPIGRFFVIMEPRRCKLPQTSRYLKKSANYLCLINIHDIRPHRYAPQSNLFLAPFPSSSSIQISSTFYVLNRPSLFLFIHPHRYRRPFRRRRRITGILKYESCWRMLAPSSSLSTMRRSLILYRLLGSESLYRMKVLLRIFCGFWRTDFCSSCKIIMCRTIFITFLFSIIFSR